MGHMNVPWAVGGGAVNDENLARMLGYFMFGGLEGILNPSDLQVVPLATPGTSVQVLPGGYNIIGRGSGQQYESYIGKVRTADVVPISATSAGSGRSDLVIARIEDPNISGEPWSDPVDPAVGPYVYTRVIENVPSTTRSVRQLGNNFSAITLARIDIPASTGTITSAMIKDVRALVNPINGPQPPPTVPPPAENDNSDDNSQSVWVSSKQGAGRYGGSGSSILTPTPVNTWRYWPTFADWIVPIPTWATGMDIFFQLNQPQFPGSAWGEFRLEIDNGALFTNAYMYDVNNSGAAGPCDLRQSMALAQSISIPSGMRGKAKRIRMQAHSLANEGYQINADASTSAYLNITFKRYPI